MIESVIICISRMANTSRKIEVKWEKDCPFIHSQKKNRSTSPKGKGNESEKEKLTVAIVNILQIIESRKRQESSCNTKLPLTPTGEQRETSSKWDNPQCPQRAFFEPKSKLPSEKISISFSRQSLERARIQKQDSTSELDDHRKTTGLTEWEGGARSTKKAYKLHKELFKIRGHYSAVHRTNFLRNYVLAEAKHTATSLAVHSKERMYTVDGGASLHMMELSSLSNKLKNTIRQPCKYSQLHPHAFLTTSTTTTNTTITLQHDSTQHDNGLALCLRVILDSGHTGGSRQPEREGRGWPTTCSKTDNRQTDDKPWDKRAFSKQPSRHTSGTTTGCWQPPGILQVKHNCGYSDRQWHRSLRHASKGLHQGSWHLSMGTFGGIFTVSAIDGKTVQWVWLFSVVADRWNSQIINRQEIDRMQHRKTSLLGSSYQTESCAIHLNSRQPKDTWARKRSGGHHVGSVEAICRMTGRKRTLHLPQLQKLGWS